MANEPPCAILNEKHEIIDYDYSRCNPMCCTALCHRQGNIYVSTLPDGSYSPIIDIVADKQIHVKCPNCGREFDVS